MTKCAFYTKGAPHVAVFSDHAALASLHKKELIKVDNMRLVTMLEKLGDYSYDIQHLPGARMPPSRLLVQAHRLGGTGSRVHQGQIRC